MTYQIPKLFPTQRHRNLVICVPALKPGLPLISDCVPDLHVNFDSQCFPRYYYEPADKAQKTLFIDVIDGYVRHDAITNFIFNACESKYKYKITQDDIFYYVYGILHSKDYQESFAVDLNKMLPRIPLVESLNDFEAFSKAGRDLANLHLNYETIEPYAKVKITGVEKGNLLVDKMRFGKILDKRNSSAKEDKTTIHFNRHVAITDIPLEAYDYVVGGRSAIAWIVERYRVAKDKDSGVVNDPNDWARERGEPRYILDLLLRIVAVSLGTIKIVDNLPKLNF
jgi:predicted helicase